VHGEFQHAFTLEDSLYTGQSRPSTAIATIPVHTHTQDHDIMIQGARWR
jgi:hypothetical protein